MLYFYNNNHLTPAGHLLTAVIVYNFLVKNNLIPFQKPLKKIDPLISKSGDWIKSANERINEFIKTDNRAKKFKGLVNFKSEKYNLAKKNLTE